MRVSFDGGRLSERGTAVALYDYAFYARALLGVEPVILHDASGTVDDEQLSRFSRAFAIRPYDGPEQRLEVLEQERVDVAYFLKVGRPLYPTSPARRTAVHEVFRFFHPHGDAYAYISSWLAEAAAASRYPAVPLIVDPPKPAAICAPSSACRPMRWWSGGTAPATSSTFPLSSRRSRRRSRRGPISGSCC